MKWIILFIFAVPQRLLWPSPYRRISFRFVLNKRRKWRGKNWIIRWKVKSAANAPAPAIFDDEEKNIREKKKIMCISARKNAAISLLNKYKIIYVHETLLVCFLRSRIPLERAANTKPTMPKPSTENSWMQIKAFLMVLRWLQHSLALYGATNRWMASSVWWWQRQRRRRRHHRQQRSGRHNRKRSNQ